RRRTVPHRRSDRLANPALAGGGESRTPAREGGVRQEFPRSPGRHLNRSAGLTAAFFHSSVFLNRKCVGLNLPTISTFVFAGIFASSPAAKKHPFTTMRRVPSHCRSSDAPIVVANARPPPLPPL